MRVLMLTDFYPPFLGGVALQVAELSRELVARGYDVAVATLGHDGLPNFEVTNSVRVYRIDGSLQRIGSLFRDPTHRWSAPFPDPELIWSLRRVVAIERPDIVHAHTWLVHSFIPLKSWSGAQLILSLHESSLVCARKSPIWRDEVCSGPGAIKCLRCSAASYGPLKGVPTALGLQVTSRSVRRAVDMYLPVSHDTARWTGLQVRGLPFRVIPNFVSDELGMDDGTCDSYASQLPTQPYLLFVGALGRHKGLDVLLEAYADLSNAPPLVVIGVPWSDTPNSFPDNTQVFYSWPHCAVMLAWSRSLIGLVPSIVPEAFGRVPCEAMANSRAVIASHIGALPELIEDGVSGLLVPPGDSGALRQAIMRLLTDASLRERMGQAGKQRIDELRASRVVPRFETVYHEVMDMPNRRCQTRDTSVPYSATNTNRSHQRSS